MQFIRKGPEVPDQLIQAHEEGKVVIFCGAGISKSAGVPDFRELVTRVFASLGELETPEEKAAIRQGKYDTAIGLLESRVVGGRTTVRKHVREILKPDLSRAKATATHEALLTLAREREGRYRLVTTNFDVLFEKVIEEQNFNIVRYRAPSLPVPKQRMSGLVYLHGLLEEDGTDDLENLVLSSGDFGLAYLCDRWAARFVSELLRNYVVCFVGYSLSDAVIRYIMDALAADHMLGELPAQAYAFVAYSRGREDKTFDAWKARNVTPILYRMHNHHQYLHRTLQEWAAAYRDGISGKESVVARYAPYPPMQSTEEDNYVGRVLWALVDRTGLPAKCLAELDPPPPLEWLKPLSEKRFSWEDLRRFGIPLDARCENDLKFSVVCRPAPVGNSGFMCLADQGVYSASWDRVMFQLGRWLVHHLGNPKLALWLAKQGGQLHEHFATLVRQQLNRIAQVEQGESQVQENGGNGVLSSTGLGESLGSLWRLILAGRLKPSHCGIDLWDWRRRLNREGLTPALRMELRKALAPRVRLREPLAWRLDSDVSAEFGQLNGMVDSEITLSADAACHALQDLSSEPNWQASLPELLRDFTMLLRDALDLMRELGEANDRRDSSWIHHPSVEEHSQSKGFREWTALIDLTRDAWLATAQTEPERARIAAKDWWHIGYPLFKRLVLFAAAHGRIFSPQERLDWLLADEHWWLWSLDTQRESFRLITSLATQLDTEGVARLENAILEGPPPAMQLADEALADSREEADREIWLRLAKLQAAGARLTKHAATRLTELEGMYPQWELAPDERDEFPIWMESGRIHQRFNPTPKEQLELVNWLKEHPDRVPRERDDWLDRCRHDLPGTAWALLRLAEQNHWPFMRWEEALQAWSNDVLSSQSWLLTGQALANSADEVLRQLAYSVSRWAQSVAKTFETDESQFLALIQRILALHSQGDGKQEDDDVLAAINHPVGCVTDAALQWWYRQSPRDAEGLPEPIRELFTQVCDTGVTSFRHGRVLLSAHLIPLFRVERPWAELHLLPLFGWGSVSAEARAVWKGFLWSPRLYPPLVQALKKPFLETARHYDELGEHGQQYAALLTYAFLELRELFTQGEMIDVVRTLPIPGLESSARALALALEGAGEQSANYWRNRVRPYIQGIWPKSRNRRTAEVSTHFSRICLAAEHEFPDAVQELGPWLKQIENPHFLVHRLAESSLCSDYPEAALELLDRIMGQGPQWLPRDLGDCLDAIRETSRITPDDRRFARLHRLRQQHGS